MTQDNHSKVTVAIPTFNRASLLGQTIDSVLKQSYKNFEIIVSDNCSSDNTGALVAGYHDKRIVYFRQIENLGMVGNWNFCLQQATGEFFLLLSDDDLLEQDAIERLLSVFSDEAVVLSYSPVSYIDKDGVPMPGISMRSPLAESGSDFITSALSGKRVVFPAAAIYRTRIALQLGGYPPIGTATDLALHLMVAMRGQVVHNPRPLVRYRMHSQSLSSTKQAIESQENLVKWCKSDSCPLKRFEAQIARRSVNFIFIWGRLNAFEGNQESAGLALKMLQRMVPSPKWAAWFYIFNTPFVRVAAKIFAQIKHFAKQLIFRQHLS